jgi:hypothetical protein
MTEVLIDEKFCNQACVERRPSNAVRKREKMRNAHISEMRSKLVPNLLQQLETSSANTTCRQLVNRFVTTCAFLRVYHVCILKSFATCSYLSLKIELKI